MFFKNFVNFFFRQIRKAYRKKALACHPDKNPDNPKAAELFHELSKALEVLLDVAARSAYDKVINAKKAAELRNKQLDGKRQKLKADLEARERAAFGNNSKKDTRTPEEILKSEMDRLRNEGSTLLEEEQELMRQQLRQERTLIANHWDSSQHRIKIKWKVAKTDETNGGYSEEVLRKYFLKYGDIVNLLISSNKTGSGLVEFKTKDASEMAVLYEKGDINNPLKLEWINSASNKKSKPINATSTVSENDFESLVLRQMRQAEERKRLIEKLKEEDE